MINKKPPGPAPPNPNPGPTPISIRYGDIIFIRNKQQQINLQGCARDNCSKGRNVSLPTLDQNGTPAKWKILSPNSLTGEVMQGDTVVFQNVFDNSYLSTCGYTNDNCGLNVVSFERQTPTDAEYWVVRLLSGTYTTKSPILSNTEVEISSVKYQIRMAACGYHDTLDRFCGVNVSLNDTPGAILDSQTWTMIV